jgi:predicted small lipoprotein YifL
LKSVMKLLMTLVLLTLLAACQTGGPVETPAPTPSDAEITPTSQPVTPTPTPTPLPDRVILILDPASQVSWATSLTQTVERLAGETGLDFQVASSISAPELGPEVRLVILTSNSVSGVELASAALQTMFLAVGIPGVTASENLSVIGPLGDRPDLQGFLAGYIAAVATQDWRVGVLGVSDVAAGRAATLAFTAGAEYFCGLCNPPFPPFAYPQIAELSAGAALAEWQAAANGMTTPEIDVRTIYLPPDAWDEELARYLVEKGVYLIGSQTPPEDLGARWLATVSAEPSAALETLWSELLSGVGGQELEMPVGYSNVNSAVFTPGRQQLVDRMLVDLLSGLIDPGVDPMTGEPR